MKTKKVLGYGLIVVMLAVAFIACEEPETSTTTAHEHQWGAWDVTLAANCTTAGSRTRTCTLDPTHKETEVIPVNDDHDWGEWTGTVTCTEAGTGTRVCSRNPTKHIETNDNLPPLGHAYNDEDWEVTEPSTCTAKGREEANCVRYAECGNTGTREIAINPNAHDWQVSTGTAPTCTEDGNGVEICSYNQEHIINGILPKLGHDYQNWTQTTAPTCTTAGVETGTCIRDHVTTTRTGAAPLGHDYQNWQQTIAPTCTTAGEETGTCTHDNAHTTTRPKAIDPNAHDWNTAYTTITAATETTNGIEVVTCKHNVSHTKEQRTLYATGTVGLDFALISINGGTNNAYRVYNTDDSNGTAIGDIFIPAYYRPNANSAYLPITQINNGNTNFQSSNAFGGINSGPITPNTTVTGITFAQESQLTTISNYAFYYCTSLTSVTLPNSVTSIGTYVFYYCTSLVDINIPDGVTTIGNNVFSGCTSLVDINIPDGVTTIGGGTYYDGAFYGCTSLTSVTIGAGVTTIGNNAFQNCTSLRNIIIDNDKAITYNGNSFSQSNNWLNIFPADNLSVTFKKNVPNLAFSSSSANTRLTSVTIAEGVTSIGQQAFSNCASLTSITIPASVTSFIGYNAFTGSGLTSVTFNGTFPFNNTKFTVSAFPGDLYDKFYANSDGNGTPGTYIVTSGTGNNRVWTKQP